MENRIFMSVVRIPPNLYATGFTSTGGGFFHDHAIGQHQVDHVTQTQGMRVQEVLDDLTCLPTVEMMLSNMGMRKSISGYLRQADSALVLAW